MNNDCRICGSENNSEEYILKEMMFGLNERFDYFKCSNCGCLQITSIPENMEKYYPSDYLSYPEPKRNRLRKLLSNKREKSYLSGKGIFGKILISAFGFNDPDLNWFSKARLNKSDSILEIGCGNAKLLTKLRDAGFRKLLGIDKFIQNEVIVDDNFKILKKNLEQIEHTNFDWIMFHHSFEHLQNPNETFKKLKELIKPNGNVLIRIPLIDSYAWEHYGTDWVQLDPPRHFFIHTVKSIKYLSDKFDFKIRDIVYDSTAFQFLGSEQYKKNIPLMSPDSYFINPLNSIFKETDLELFTQKAEELNRNRIGDTACFFLRNSE